MKKSMKDTSFGPFFRRQTEKLSGTVDSVIRWSQQTYPKTKLKVPKRCIPAMNA
jgi:hypothetical protein